MTDGKQKRTYLDWWKEKENGDVADMTAAYPGCVCETADPTADGFGPIQDDERLRYFVVSRSDIDLKRGPNRQITDAIFKRCFKKGMSTARLCYATRKELNLSAKILYNHQVSTDVKYGGVLGAIDFLASKVRFPSGNSCQVCCVVDTPLKGRPAHADIVSSKSNLMPAALTSLRLILFNAIGGAKAFVPAKDVKDCDLECYRPAALNP